MNAHEFLGYIGRAFNDAAKSVVPAAGQPFAEVLDDLATRLNGQQNGITATIQAPGTLRVDSPAGDTLYLVVPSKEPRLRRG